MEKKNMKKVFAAVMSASMLMGSAMPALAADVDVTAPIYSFDMVDVVVPTSYAVAFNPEGLTVKKGAGTSTDQILSKNFGIINKSNKDKVITATLTVEDLNADSGITFVNSADDVDAAEDGEYKIHLTAVPADTSEVKIGSASADESTTADALGDVAMTAATDKAVTLKAGENLIGFKLEKATYSPKSGSEIELGTSTSNNVQDNFEITALAGAGKGITAFTFGGEMNVNTDWYKLQSGIKISAVYANETAPSNVEVIDGTGAMVPVESAPSIGTTSVNFSKTSGAEITVDLGEGDLAATGISSVVTVGGDGNPYTWAAADYSFANSKLTLKNTAQYLQVASGNTRTVKVTFNDTAATVVSLTVTIQD